MQKSTPTFHSLLAEYTEAVDRRARALSRNVANRATKMRHTREANAAAKKLCAFVGLRAGTLVGTLATSKAPKGTSKKH